MISVVLLMAGKGSRMGYERNKMLLPFGEQYLFEFPLQTFLKFGFEIICVISKEDEDVIVPRLPAQNVKYTYGGNSRSESVLAGLKKATGDYILVHDAARMWISEELIQEIEEKGNRISPVLTYMSVKDTIKEKTDSGITTLDRSRLLAASTPQCATKELFLEVYEAQLRDGFVATDDISLIEHYHPEIEIKLVEAKDTLFKVTTPMDYELAKMIWRSKQ